MSYYAVHSHMTEAEREHRRRLIELDDLLKAMRQQQDLIHLNLGIWLRNGPSRELRERINEAAAAYGEAFSEIMGSTPPRIEAPKARNRY
jgi:hypothetical protein